MARNISRAIASELVLRDMTDADVARGLSSEIPSLSNDGLPNYFDDQRFGSVGYSGQFIGHAWLTGDHERALKLAAWPRPIPFDRSGIKGQKRPYCGPTGRRQWTEAKARLERIFVRSQHCDVSGRSSDRLPRGPSRELRPAS